MLVNRIQRAVGREAHVLDVTENCAPGWAVPRLIAGAFISPAASTLPNFMILLAMWIAPSAAMRLYPVPGAGGPAGPPPFTSVILSP